MKLTKHLNFDSNTNLNNNTSSNSNILNRNSISNLKLNSNIISSSSRNNNNNNNFNINNTNTNYDNTNTFTEYKLLNSTTNKSTKSREINFVDYDNHNNTNTNNTYSINNTLSNINSNENLYNLLLKLRDRNTKLESSLEEANAHIIKLTNHISNMKTNNNINTTNKDNNSNNNEVLLDKIKEYQQNNKKLESSIIKIKESVVLLDKNNEILIKECSYLKDTLQKNNINYKDNKEVNVLEKLHKEKEKNANKNININNTNSKHIEKVLKENDILKTENKQIKKELDMYTNSKISNTSNRKRNNTKDYLLTESSKYSNRNNNNLSFNKSNDYEAINKINKENIELRTILKQCNMHIKSMKFE